MQQHTHQCQLTQALKALQGQPSVQPVTFQVPVLWHNTGVLVEGINPTPQLSVHLVPTAYDCVASALPAGQVNLAWLGRDGALQRTLFV